MCPAVLPYRVTRTSPASARLIVLLRSLELSRLSGVVAPVANRHRRTRAMIWTAG
jgi:hypothetical protein